MKILHIITGLNYGGAEKLLLDICSNMNVENKIYVIYFKGNGALEQKFKNNGINVNFFKASKYNFLSVFIKIYKFIKEQKFDVVHTHLSYANFIGRSAAIFANVPKVFTTIHNTDRWLSSKKFKYKVANWIEQLITNNKRVRIIFISTAVAEYSFKYQNISEDKTYILPNAININQTVALSNQQEEENNKLSIIKENDFIISNVGRLVEQKGQIYLLKAMNQIVNDLKINNIKCLIVGEGEERETLESFIQENKLSKYISLVGVHSNPYYFVKKADLFIMSSIWEGFGIVILEAQAVGTPILASKVEGIKELVTHNENGILVESRNVEKLREEIINFYSGKYNTQKFINNGKEKAAYYSIENYTKKLYELYTK